MTIVAYVLMVLSWIFIAFGMIAIFSLKNLYTRILTAATIDTVASLLLLISLIFVAQRFDYGVRLMLLVLFLMITGPISSHVNIRSAYLIGIPLDMKDGESHE